MDTLLDAPPIAGRIRFPTSIWRGVLPSREGAAQQKGMSSTKDAFLNQLGEGSCLAEGAAQQMGHVQHQGYFLNQLGEGSCLAEGAAQQKGHVQHQGFFLNQLGEGSC